MHRRRPRRCPGAGTSVTATGSTVVARTHEYPRLHWQHHRRNLGCAGFFCLLVLRMACRPLREQAQLPQRGSGVHRSGAHHKSPVGAELARDGGGSACSNVGCDGLIASNLPQGSRVFIAPAFTTNPLWELSLLAMAVGLLAVMLDVTASSRASSLPQGSRVFIAPAPTTNPLWELSLLAMAVGLLAVMLDMTASSRAISHRVLGCSSLRRPPQIPCGN